MFFDRIEDRDAGLCAIFRTDLRAVEDENGFVHFYQYLTSEKNEVAYNEESLVGCIANLEREGHSVEQERIGLTVLRRRKQGN